VIAYRATLEVPRELAQYVARLLLAERLRRGTPKGSRALTCFWQAVLGLRWFRDRTTPDALARDHGVSRATDYRYLDEVITVLAGQAPELREALERANDEGLSHVILDGTIIPADRCREPALSIQGEVIALWYPGKAHTHGGNIQAVLAPSGFPLWVSPAEPGSVQTSPPRASTPYPPYRTAAAPPAHPGRPRPRRRRHWHPHPGQATPGERELDISTRTRNALLRSLRCLGERGFALLTGRLRTLQHVTAPPGTPGSRQWASGSKAWGSSPWATSRRGQPCLRRRCRRTRWPTRTSEPPRSRQC